MVLQWVNFQGVGIRSLKKDRERECYHTRWQKGMLRPGEGSFDTFCLGRMTSMVWGGEFANWGIAVSILAIGMTEE